MLPDLDLMSLDESELEELIWELDSLSAEVSAELQRRNLDEVYEERERYN